MKSKINPARRNFFAKFGIGALSAGVLNMMPFKILASSLPGKKKSENTISIVIDPMAVKRTKKG